MAAFCSCLQRCSTKGGGGCIDFGIRGQEPLHNADMPASRSGLQRRSTMASGGCIDVNIGSQKPLYDIEVTVFRCGLQCHLQPLSTITASCCFISGQYLLHNFQMAAFGSCLQRRKLVL